MLTSPDEGLKKTRTLPNTLPGTLPEFDDLSPDFQYQLVCQWQLRDWAITSLTSLASVALLAVVAVPPLNVIADATVQAVFHGGEIYDQLPGDHAVSVDFAAPVLEGEQIASYPVTSGYGLRDTSTLPAGASADHKGVDLGTPIGTTLYAPGEAGNKVKIRCWRDLDGGGLVADIKTPAAPTLSFQALHLADCTTGMIDGGQPFATTGDTGIGAAHLDWRQRDRTTKVHQHPQKHYLLWTLTGNAPRALLGEVDILRNAIIGQESNFVADEINDDSGALGLGQVMPDNLVPLDENGDEIPNSGWDYEALGEDLTPTEFLADANKQIKVINYQLRKIHQQQLADGHGHDEAIKRTAAIWYSGNPARANDPSPEYWQGDKEKEYPSVKEYSAQVLARVKTLQRKK